ncbi:Glucan endo-1,3-beta-D-glucosidase [Cardamine amara subsp. amara]|uniref:Glucan endo-1,3-beta-D-glucosidase n=1 Tax=Cardamine amara subsp. amara TaxID=228776 RepID=A0ABD1BBL0_CARAN
MASSTPKNDPFLFPKTKSSFLPDPSRFFSKDLLSNPLPTKYFFQNFTPKNGDQAEYFHPYLIKSSASSLSISYPSLFNNSVFFYEVFEANVIISGSNRSDSHTRKSHLISSFSDLGVTLDFPSSNLRFFLVRGNPFITCSVSGNSITISTNLAVRSFSGNSLTTKYTAKLTNNQTWLI